MKNIIAGILMILGLIYMAINMDKMTIQADLLICILVAVVALKTDWTISKIFSRHIPSTENLSIISKQANKKESREAVKAIIKNISKVISDRAKQGHDYYFKEILCENDHYYDFYVAFRWYRRYSKLNVKTEQEDYQYSGNIKFIPAMSIRIEW